jgi:hypothetical protein
VVLRPEWKRKKFGVFTIDLCVGPFVQSGDLDGTLSSRSELTSSRRSGGDRRTNKHDPSCDVPKGANVSKSPRDIPLASKVKQNGQTVKRSEDLIC